MTPEAQRCSAPELTDTKCLTRGPIWANFVLAGSGIVTALIFGYFFYHYIWIGNRQFISWRGAVFNIVAPGVISAFFFASLGMRASHKIRLAAGCCALNMFLLGAELKLELSQAKTSSLPFWGIDQASDENKQVIIKLAQQAGVPYDTRDHKELFAELRQRGIDAVPAVMLGRILDNNSGIKISDNSNGSELMPIGAIADKTTVLCNESGQYVTYESDEHGFRNPRGIWQSARADIAALGESFVQGYCVPDGKNFVDLFRKVYPVTLNLGLSGESSLLQLAAIKEYLPRYAPKIVLWVFCEGIDLYDLRDEAKRSLLMRYLESNFSQRLLSRQNEIDHALGRFAADSELRTRGPKPASGESALVSKALEITKLSNLRQKLGLVYGITHEDPEALLRSEGATWDVFRNVLSQAKTLTSNWGGTLYFVYLPSWERYGKDLRVPELERARVLKLVGSVGIPLIDVQPAFQAHNDPLSLFPLRAFGHYNELGNQIVSDTVLKVIAR